MAPIPAPSPTALTGYSAPFAAAGGGNQFQSSGPCSGTAWTHTQDITIFYEVVTIPQNAGTWLPSTTDVSALKLTVMGNAEDSLAFFSTSSVSGASGCATAADARQAHVLSLSSTDVTTVNAMGSTGAIITLSGGYERRWTQVGDVDQTDNRFYGNALFEINGLPNNWIYDPTLSVQVARQIISRVCNGGIRHSGDGTAPPTTAGNWPLMKFSLMDT
jgi:hypothetical protein